MRLGELLDRVPGLEKRFVYYLEAQGVVRPTRLPKNRIDRRDYSEEDAGQIRRVWRHYRRGYSLSAARELADLEAGTRAYAFLGAGPGHHDQAIDALRASDRVVEASVVYGESSDVLACIEAARDEDVFEALHPVFDRGVLTGLPRIFKARRLLRPAPRSPDRRGKDHMRAYVLLKVPAKQVDRTLERLHALPGIAEASAVYGETDIIAKLEVPSQTELDDLVIRQLQGIPEVEATRTFIVVGGLHWSRS